MNITNQQAVDRLTGWVSGVEENSNRCTPSTTTPSLPSYPPAYSPDCPHCGRCPSCGRGGHYPQYPSLITYTSGSTLTK